MEERLTRGSEGTRERAEVMGWGNLDKHGINHKKGKEDTRTHINTNTEGKDTRGDSTNKTNKTKQNNPGPYRIMLRNNKEDLTLHKMTKNRETKTARSPTPDRDRKLCGEDKRQEDLKNTF